MTADDTKGRSTPASSGSGRSGFDPAAWLERAERCGYRIYLSSAPGGDRFYIVTEAPYRRKSQDDMALWHEFQGRPEHSRANRAALIAHLLRIGRIGRTGGGAEHPSKRELAGSQRPRAKTPVGDAQNGR